MLAGGEHQHGFGGGQIPGENPGCRQILVAIQSPATFFLVPKIVIPDGLMRILRVGESRYRRQAGVRRPTNLVGADLRLESKRWIGLMERVVVPAGKKRADA